jgi:hypothetical protein
MTFDPFSRPKRRGQPRVTPFSKGLKAQVRRIVKLREQGRDLPRGMPGCSWEEALQRYDEWVTFGEPEREAASLVAQEMASRRWVMILTRFDAVAASAIGWENALEEVAAEMEVTPERLRGVLRERGRVQRRFALSNADELSAGIAINDSDH